MIHFFLFAFRQAGEHDPQSGGGGLSELLLHQGQPLLHMGIRGQVCRQIMVDADLPGQEKGRDGQGQEKAEKDCPFFHQEGGGFFHGHQSSVWFEWGRHAFPLTGTPPGNTIIIDTC